MRVWILTKGRKEFNRVIYRAGMVSVFLDEYRIQGPYEQSERSICLWAEDCKVAYGVIELTNDYTLYDIDL